MPTITNVLARASVPTVAFTSAIAIDISTKWLLLNVLMVPPRTIEIAPFFNVTLGFNTGVSFGLLQATFAERAAVLIFAQTIIAAGFLLWAFCAKQLLDRMSLALIAGGAVGNAIDRIQHGAVTDFLDFHLAGWHWPTFNLADTAIALGVLTLVVSSLVPPRPTQPVTERQPDS